MNNLVGALSRAWDGMSASGGASLGAREGPYGDPIREKYQQIPSPANLFVILDEHPGSINDGDFFTDPDTAGHLVDYPGGYHNGAGGVSFADGHVEIHKWVDPRTTPFFVPGQYIALNVNLPGDPDVTWLQHHAIGTP